MVALAALTWTLRPWAPTGPPMPSISTLPPKIEGWQASGLKLDREFLGTATFSEWVHRRYEKDGAAVDVMLGTDDRLDPRIDFDSPKTAIPGSAWEVVADGTVELPNGRVADRFVAELANERQLVVRWIEGVGGRGEEIARSILALDRTRFRRDGRALVVRLATPIDVDGREGAEARIAAFAALLDPVIPRGGPPAAQ